MTNEVLIGVIASIVGGTLVAFTNHVFIRDKTKAEAKKLEAEALKIEAETSKLISELDINQVSFENNSKLPKGWFIAGSHPEDYVVGIDDKVAYKSGASGHIKSQKTAKGFATLMQLSKVGVFIGKRVKMSAYVKAEGVAGWAGLWMRVDEKLDKSTSFDNMQDRPIKGTVPWMKYDIILDVPENSNNLAYGILLSGDGDIWIDDITFEIVTDEPLTDLNAKKQNRLLEQPFNLDFSNFEE